MQYLKYIFESNDVRSLTEEAEESITTIVEEAITPFLMNNFKYVVENLEKFIDNDDLVTSFEDIKTFARNDMVNMISAISEVAALDESDFDHVNAIMLENVSNVFMGVGYGTQKAQRLISSSYC
jgi:hypothetical protein